MFALAEEEKYVWAGTSGGLAKIDKISGITTYVNKANSGLPENRVNPVTIDRHNNKWIGMPSCGLARYDGTTRMVFNASNSGLPSDYVSAVAIDNTDIPWIGTAAGLARFDGTHSVDSI